MQSWRQPHAHTAPHFSRTEGCWRDRGCRRHAARRRTPREAANLSDRRVKSASSRFASRARFAKDVSSFVDVSVRRQRDGISPSLDAAHAGDRRAARAMTVAATERLECAFERRQTPNGSITRVVASAPVRRAKRRSCLAGASKQPQVRRSTSTPPLQRQSSTVQRCTTARQVRPTS